MTPRIVLNVMNEQNPNLVYTCNMQYASSVALTCVNGTLFDEYGRNLASLLSSNVSELLQLLGADLSEVSEEENELELNSV
jgi:hypothetical protein